MIPENSNGPALETENVETATGTANAEVKIEGSITGDSVDRSAELTPEPAKEIEKELEVDPIEDTGVPNSNAKDLGRVLGEEPDESRNPGNVQDDAAFITLEVQSVKSNGALEKSKEGFTIRLVPTDSFHNKAFFLSAPPFIDLQVVNPIVAKVFTQGTKVTMALAID